MKTILITGCAGFIGSHLTDALLERGCQVLGVDNFHPYYDRSIKESNLLQALQSERFTFHEGDILDVDFLHRIFQENKIDVVVHLAAIAGVRKSFEQPEGYFKINVKGTQSVFETALKFAVPHFVFASSSSVYGEMQGDSAVEDETPLSPISPYAESKVQAENLIRELFKEYNFSVNVLRFFTVYGERQRPDMAFQKFRKIIQNGGVVDLYGEQMSRDFTPVPKIISGILAAIDYQKGLEVFNLGCGQRVLVKDMIMQIGEELGLTPEIRIAEQPEGDPSFTLADISKAQRLLGY